MGKSRVLAGIALASTLVLGCLEARADSDPSQEAEAEVQCEQGTSFAAGSDARAGCDVGTIREGTRIGGSTTVEGIVRGSIRSFAIGRSSRASNNAGVIGAR